MLFVVPILGSVVQESLVSENVIPLFIRGEKDPYWYSVSFQESETQVHRTCPTFIHCPDIAGYMETISGDVVLVNHLEAAIPFHNSYEAPKFHDVAGRIGLGFKSAIAENHAIGISCIESRIIIDFHNKPTIALNEAEFKAETTSNGWSSYGSFTLNNTGGGISVGEFMNPRIMVQWDPLGDRITLPKRFEDPFKSMKAIFVHPHMYMPCSVLESGQGGELIITERDNSVVIPIVKIKNSLRFKLDVPYCGTNVYFSTSILGAIVGMSSLLERYDVELVHADRSVRFLNRNNMNKSLPQFPIHHGLHAFRIANVTDHGWVWKRSDKWDDKDFIFTSNWPFVGGDVDFVPARPGAPSTVVKPPQVYWIGKAKFDLLSPGGDIAVSQQFSWNAYSMSVINQRISLSLTGVRYVWIEKNFNGPQQQLLAKPVLSGPPQNGEFILKDWPPIIKISRGSMSIVSSQDSDDDDDGVWGLWFGLPVASMDSYGVLTITAQMNGQTYVVAKYSNKLDFNTAIDRYIPIWTPNKRLEFIQVHGPNRHLIEVEITGYKDFNGHFELTIKDVPDRIHSKAYLEILNELHGMELKCRAIIYKTMNGLAVDLEPADMITRITIESSDDTTTISMDQKDSVRFQIHPGISFHGDRVIIPKGNKFGALRAGEFVYVPSRFQKIAEGKWMLKLAPYKRTESMDGPFGHVGIFNGFPTITINDLGNLEITAEPSGHLFFQVKQFEFDDCLFITFESLSWKNIDQVASLVTISPSEVDEGIQCPICLEKFQLGDKLAQLHVCKHRLHRECLISLQESNAYTCPYCRRVMNP